ncbi:MAG: heme o synthase [Chloroflexota bacterium]
MQLEQSYASEPVVEVPPRTELWRTIVVLFKLRVVSLLLLSAFGGAVLGYLATGQSSLWAWLMLTVSGTLSAAGASGINQYLERERDTQMRRTAKRPLAANEISNPRTVLWISMGMILLATLLALTVNIETAVFILLGAIIYVGVYTIWLKPRTTLNIVIGGAAGSCAVISGGAAMGGWSETAVWLLAALVFVWTPVHFWALALAYRDDYSRAAFPMLPACTAPRTAARWIALHTLFTVAAGIGLGLVPQLDLFYLVPITLLSLLLIKRTWQLLAAPEKQPALSLFHFSNIYLAVVLVVVMLAPVWR